VLVEIPAETLPVAVLGRLVSKTIVLSTRLRKGTRLSVNVRLSEKLREGETVMGPNLGENERAAF